jgi:long-chain acyl-CoA synthetase
MFWNDRSNDNDEKIFIVDGERTHTFKEIFSFSDLLYSDISKGAVVVIESVRDLGTVCAYIGALRNNIVPLLIDSNLNSESVADIANSYKAEYIIGSKTRNMSGYLELDKQFEKIIYSRSESLDVKVHKDLCMLMSTSGSTGEAKCVRTSRDNLLLATQSIVRYLAMDSSRVSISSLPLHYTFGLSVLNCALESRSKFVLTDKSWLERGFWKTIEDKKISDLSGVPFMFQTLRRINLSDEILNNLICVNQAGGKLEPELTKHFINYFSHKNIYYYTMYGATEASPRISYVPYKMALEKLGTVGIPIDIGKFSTDADDGVSEGELIYEGPNVCLGYARNREDLLLGNENNQVLYTGDIGFIDSDGYATIIGRKKRFVKVSGISVNLDSLESIAKNISDNSVVVGKDDKILVLTTDNKTNFLKQKILEKVTFHNTVLQVKKISEIYLNSSGKPDYPSMVSEFL